MNIALILSYDGTNYNGWQIQKNGASIQQTVSEALEKLLNQKISLSGVGRTDSGVHARRYIANFRAQCHIPLDRLHLALNANLPQDISILCACEVPKDFDARFNCIKKEYVYYIYPSKIRDPFLNKHVYRHGYPLDVCAMKLGAKHFVGTQDFAAVRALGTPVKSTVRTIYWCNVETMPNGVIKINVCGDGFLYNMVRAIAGTLVYVGSGKIKPDEVKNVLLSLERSNAGPTLPANGLFMNRLWYETPELLPYNDLLQ